MGTLAGEKRQGTIGIRRVKGVNVIEGEIVYRVVASSKLESRLSVLQTPGLPIVGVTQSISLGLCKSKYAIRNELQPTEWEVVCGFSSDVEEGTDPTTPQSGGTGSSNPLEWIPLIEPQFEPYEELFSYDADGSPFKNSAGSWLGPISLPLNIIRWDFFQFEDSSLKLKTIADRNDTVNPQEYLQCEPKTLRLSIRRAVLGYYYGQRCWLIEYTLRYRRERTIPSTGRKIGGWRMTWPDEGPKYLSAGVAADYYDGQPGVSGPLDGSGGRQSTHATGPYLLTFDRYKTDPWQFLRISATA